MERQSRHKLLTLCFVKGTRGYVIKGRAETLPFITITY